VSGDVRRDEGGQLAALDAMVFFALAMLISSSTFAYVEGVSSEHGTEAALSGECDPGQVLLVFMRASVGVEVTLDLGGEVPISSREEVATCLSAELDALAGGCGVDRFDPLNDALLTMLGKLVGIGYSAHLSAYRTTDDGAEPILVLEEAGCVSENRYSGSCEVPGAGGSAYVVVLVLGPALLPELGLV